MKHADGSGPTFTVPFYAFRVNTATTVSTAEEDDEMRDRLKLQINFKTQSLPSNLCLITKLLKVETFL